VDRGGGRQAPADAEDGAAGARPLALDPVGVAVIDAGLMAVFTAVDGRWPRHCANREMKIDFLPAEKRNVISCQLFIH
jgi:hypothetical protein